MAPLHDFFEAAPQFDQEFAMATKYGLSLTVVERNVKVLREHAESLRKSQAGVLELIDDKDTAVGRALLARADALQDIYADVVRQVEDLEAIAAQMKHAQARGEKAGDVRRGKSTRATSSSAIQSAVPEIRKEVR
eukprot:TRINITY_DN61462_c0_g1_i1.p1 TRINITY_DN61462_c0_g1~~TRINITY_DN61462_c0_g1_i1.p1  ORF type:complete len:135 (-),score=26.28 TRINITY_DN61462_c0_g1_i1:189-593(-)